MSEEKQIITIKIPMKYYRRLMVLREALKDKMGKEMTMDELMEKVIEDFLSVG